MSCLFDAHCELAVLLNKLSSRLGREHSFVLCLSLPLPSSPPGLQRGVGEPHPGAAEEGEQPDGPAGPQTDRRHPRGGLGGRVQHLSSQ